MDTTRIAQQLGRSVVAVRLAARSLGCRIINVMASWTEEELAILRLHYGEGTRMQQLSQLLPGRNPKAIRTHAAKLGIQNGAWLDRLWSEEELAILYRYYPSIGAKVVDKLPGRTPEAAKQMASSLKVRAAGFSTPSIPKWRWTDKEWQILEDNVHLSSSELTGYLPGRTQSAIGKAKARLRAWRKNERHVS